MKCHWLLHRREKKVYAHSPHYLLQNVSLCLSLCSFHKCFHQKWLCLDQDITFKIALTLIITSFIYQFLSLATLLQCSQLLWNRCEVRGACATLTWCDHEQTGRAPAHLHACMSMPRVCTCVFLLAFAIPLHVDCKQHQFLLIFCLEGLISSQ